MEPDECKGQEGGDRRFYGKYRGTVLQNTDPYKRGRLLVTVPSVLGAGVSSWAEPTMPMGGMIGLPSGMWLTPPVGAGAWVEFAEGDSNFPIWSGCWFASPGDAPLDANTSAPGQEPIVLQTETFKLMIARERIELGLASPGGALTLGLVMTPGQVSLTNGSGAMINLTGKTVDINGGGLTVLY